MIKKVILAFAIVLAFAACKNNQSTHENAQQQVAKETTTTMDQSKHTDYSGNYVTEDYNRRKEGYDWLVVTATKLSDSTMHFTVRARIDRKKATCSFGGDGLRVKEGVYKAKDGEYAVLFTFKDNTVTIGGQGKADDEPALHWFCSGGASLSDYTFTKLNVPLDETQLKSRK